MSILGVIVRSRPTDTVAVYDVLRGMPGLDIVAEAAGRFVVVIEDSDQATAADVMTRVTRLPQVLNTSLVYEYSGPDAPAPAGDAIEFRSWRGDQRAGA